MQAFWFIVIAFFWTGFFILEGFDMGVGTLHMIVGKTDIERRVAINSIGPFWDGNEVWLVVAGAGTFAAFPLWYASMFSALYLAVMLVILALIIRGVSFEYRGKLTNPRWRATWDWSLTIGSALLPVLLGIMLGRPLSGFAAQQRRQLHGFVLGPLYGLRGLVRFHLVGAVVGARSDIPEPQNHRGGTTARPTAGRALVVGGGPARPRVFHLDPRPVR